MARPGWPERNRVVRSFRQLRRFHHVIKSDAIIGGLHHHYVRIYDFGTQPAHAAGGNQDRHVMMTSPSIYTYSNARHSCWLSAGTAQARIAALHSIAVARPILSRYPQIARSHRRMRPWFAASR